jgi:hypothetical protein
MVRWAQSPPQVKSDWLVTPIRLKTLLPSAGEEVSWQRWPDREWPGRAPSCKRGPPRKRSIEEDKNAAYERPTVTTLGSKSTKNQASLRVIQAVN